MRRLERFKAEHGSNYSLDEPVILLHHLIQIFALANLDAFVLVNVVLLDAGRIGAAFVDINQAGFAVGPYGLVQKSASCFLIALGRQQKVDSIALLVDGSIEVFPLTSDFDIRVSKLKEPPLQLLAEPSVNLSAHWAPIIQQMVYIQASNEEKG